MPASDMFFSAKRKLTPAVIEANIAIGFLLIEARNSEPTRMHSLPVAPQCSASAISMTIAWDSH